MLPSGLFRVQFALLLACLMVATQVQANPAPSSATQAPRDSTAPRPSFWKPILFTTLGLATAVLAGSAWLYLTHDKSETGMQDAWPEHLATPDSRTPRP